MAHFAQINENNVVIQVLRVPDEQEHRGQDFLANDLGLGGTWVQTSFNNNIRGKFAGLDYIYDPTNDVFIEPCPAKGWVLSGTEWVPPIPKPDNNHIWDEATEAWILKEIIDAE